NLVREISLLEYTFPFRPLDNSPLMMEYYTREAKELEQRINSRVTFIALDGQVVGDSEKNAADMDNHLNREEIVSASQGEFASVIRHSETLHEDMLYVAHKVYSDEGFDGYIRLSMSLKAIDEGMNRGWTWMARGLVSLFLAAGLPSYRIAGGMTKPLEDTTRVANRIPRLDDDARVKLEHKDEIGQLGFAINGMADSLQQQL